MTDLSHLETLVREATPGPWVASDQHAGGHWRIETDADGYPNDGWIICSELLGPDAEANARLIAELRNHADTLLSTLREQRKALEEEREACAKLADEEAKYEEAEARKLPATTIGYLQCKAAAGKARMLAAAIRARTALEGDVS